MLVPGDFSVTRRGVAVFESGRRPDGTRAASFAGALTAGSIGAGAIADARAAAEAARAALPVPDGAVAAASLGAGAVTPAELDASAGPLGAPAGGTGASSVARGRLLAGDGTAAAARWDAALQRLILPEPAALSVGGCVIGAADDPLGRPSVYLQNPDGSRVNLINVRHT